MVVSNHVKKFFVHYQEEDHLCCLAFLVDLLIIVHNRGGTRSGHVESGKLGGTLFSGGWGIVGEDISRFLSSSGLVLVGADSGGISSSWLMVSKAGAIWANFSEVIIGAGMGVSGGDKGSNGCTGICR